MRKYLKIGENSAKTLRVAIKTVCNLRIAIRSACFVTSMYMSKIEKFFMAKI